MRIEETKLEGCFELTPEVHKDERGIFVKTFHKDTFAEKGLETHFAEEYYSVSRQRVLRGLHFQTPPMDHVKLVYCVLGKVTDVVLDLRKQSQTYGKFETFELDADKHNMIYIPKGMAHGFYVLSESATLLYKVTTIYSSSNDSGVLWNSAGVPWPDDNPIMSERDKGFARLEDFDTPF